MILLHTNQSSYNISSRRRGTFTLPPTLLRLTFFPSGHTHTSSSSSCERRGGGPLVLYHYIWKTDDLYTYIHVVCCIMYVVLFCCMHFSVLYNNIKTKNIWVGSLLLHTCGVSLNYWILLPLRTDDYYIALQSIPSVIPSVTHTSCTHSATTR